MDDELRNVGPCQARLRATFANEVAKADVHGCGEVPESIQSRGRVRVLDHADGLLVEAGTFREGLLREPSAGAFGAEPLADKSPVGEERGGGVLHHATLTHLWRFCRYGEPYIAHAGRCVIH